MATPDADRARKFRQAAIVYLHYALLYWIGAWVLVERDLFPAARGPAWMWFVAGAAIGLGITAALWWWRNPWFARVLWCVVALRLPTLIEGAFFPLPGGVPPGLHLAAAIVVLVVLAFLARAGWDL